MFATVYDPMMKGVEQLGLAQRRAQLLSGLQGKILEVGSGTGANFQYYSDGANVIGCEPSVAMYDKGQALLNDRVFQAQINLVNMGVHDDRLFKIISNGSLDAVVCTLVLCSVPDHITALRNFKHWLKPDGKLIILEHVRAKNPVGSFAQDIAAPLWHFCADGCNLNRATDEDLKYAGFKPVYEEYFDLGLPWYMSKMRPA